MTRVPFLDVGAAYRELRSELDAAYAEVMQSGRFLGGEQLFAFEREWAAASGAAGAAAVGSGFDALVLGLRAVGVEPGAEVLVPAHTAVMTWLAVAAIGAVPVGVDVSQTTYTLDPDLLDGAASQRTRAVVPVHLYGRPAAMEEISAWAAERGARVLGDGAQAHGARLAGRPLGGLGDAAAWSFYPSKNLGAFGSGGCVTSEDAEVVERVRRLRNYGFAAGGTADGLAAEAGVNSRLDELQAAFLRVRLRRLEEWNERRREHARGYLEDLAGLDLVLPPRDEGCESAWHQFVVRVAERERVAAALRERGVETSVHYPVPAFEHPAVARFADGGAFPVARRLAAEVLSLPAGPHMSEEERGLVVAALVEALS